MAKSLVRNLARDLLASRLAKYQLHRRPLLYRISEDDVLVGYYFQDSAWNSSRFSVYVFCQPLYCHAEEFRFNFGGRLGALAGDSERQWEVGNNDEQVQQEVLSAIDSEGEPWVSRVDSAEKIALNGLRTGNSNDIYVLRDIAYSAALAGKTDAAKKSLCQAIQIAKNQNDIEWCRLLLTELSKSLVMLDSDLLALHDQLGSVTVKTKAELKL